MAFYPNINNLTKSQIENAIRESYGTDEQIQQTEMSEIVEMSMNAWTKDIILQMRDNIRDTLTPKRDGSNLAQSLKPTKITTTGTIMLIDVTANDYWHEQNYGVDGRSPGQQHAVVDPATGHKHAYSKQPYTSTPADGQSHADAILKWIPKTGFTKPPDTYDIKTHRKIHWTYESWAYVIARNIKNRGIKPKQFVERTLTDNAIKVLGKKLYELTGLHFDVVWDVEAEKQKKK